ncbi:ABC transporter ATP-binding protein [Marinomonas primoryensis]|uniref:ABC transporter ATP-binding protein n=1 Tax=Marinomonas primoryensis TaxID=178399 RepID=A0ABV0KZF6_9GAMM
MRALLAPLWAQSGLNLYMVLSSFGIHILGLTSTVFVMLVYGRYLSHGIDSTLYTLVTGALIGIGTEIFLRRARYKIVAALCASESRKLSEQVSHTSLNARSGALQSHLDLSANNGGMSTWLERIGQAVSPHPVVALLDMPFAFLLFGVLFLLAWQLALCALLVVIILLLFLGISIHRIKAITTNHQAIQGKFNNLLKNVEQPETVRINNAQDWLAQRLADGSGDSRVSKHALQLQQEKIQSQVRSATMFMSVVIISVGAALSVHGDLNFGLLIGANILSARLIVLISQPLQQMPIWLNALQAFKRVKAFIDLPEETQKGSTLSTYQGKIRFKQVMFSYPNSPLMVYENLNFVLGAGECLMVTGGNGKGKTTLARLILGLVQPMRGSILIDGVDLRQVNAYWWRQQLVYLPQDPDLLPGTLRENMTFIDGSIDDDQIKAVLHRVRLGEWIELHPEGLDMEITMRGRNLALGIRRRIAFARALLTKGQLVVLDEPLEGLDKEGIAMMQGVLVELEKEKRTLIVISQFMQPLKNGAKYLNLDERHVMQIATSHSYDAPVIAAKGMAI